jgi:methionine-rich copper-binding protein CopC
VKRKVIFMVLFFLGFGQFALAHDTLVGQFPAENQVIDAGIVEIKLDFSAEVIDIEGSSAAEVSVTGPDDSNQAQNNGCAEISGTSVLARAELVEPGKYQVAWRVVSQDGHPISGSYEFQVQNTNGYERQGFQEIQCEKLLVDQPLAEQNQESINYLLLWVSLPLLALGILILLWPRKKSGNRQGAE